MFSANLCRAYAVLVSSKLAIVLLLLQSLGTVSEPTNPTNGSRSIDDVSNSEWLDTWLRQQLTGESMTAHQPMVTNTTSQSTNMSLEQMSSILGVLADNDYLNDYIKHNFSLNESSYPINMFPLNTDILDLTNYSARFEKMNNFRNGSSHFSNDFLEYYNLDDDTNATMFQHNLVNQSHNETRLER